MAKKFLDTLGDAFEEDVLQDLIPARKVKSTPRKKRKSSPRRRKSFLETIEDALDNHAFDDISDIVPEQQDWQRKAQARRREKKVETPFSTMITTDVLDRAREIARMKGIRVKDVINVALRWYIDKEYEG